ncbi:NAD(P)H-dependent oxidoreductase [Geminicoccus sp.]|uniref:NAD(P)H-dependent oxidoreductase n=1 Tax=Geminicoccus sp. TaxID=2024832 RepID=UPI0039C86AAD
MLGEEVDQQKFRRADALILQVSLWWFTMAAILKGWVDRYGEGPSSESKRCRSSQRDRLPGCN